MIGMVRFGGSNRLAAILIEGPSDRPTAEVALMAQRTKALKPTPP